MTANVLLFSPTLGDGGADRVTLTLLRRLDRARFRPALVVVRRTGELVDDVPDDVPVHVLGCRRLAVATRPFAALLRREKPDVVFSTQGGTNIIGTLAHALAGCRARLVLSERSALRRADRSPLRSMFELPAKRWTYRHADLVTAVSKGVADDLIATLRLSRAKVRIVYNPIVDDDLAKLASAPVDHPWFATNADVPVVLAVGRLVAIKDYPTLLEAVSRIRSQRRVRLLVLGEGPLRGELDALARGLGMRDDVEFHGFDKNPFKYMARCRLFLHASKAEGLPGAIIQAMACGAPVVATDCDFGPREVITSGHDGYLVPVQMPDQLAERSLAILDDRAHANAIARNARQTAQRFTTVTAVAAYERAFEGGSTPW